MHSMKHRITPEVYAVFFRSGAAASTRFTCMAFMVYSVYPATMFLGVFLCMYVLKYTYIKYAHPRPRL